MEVHCGIYWVCRIPKDRYVSEHYVSLRLSSLLRTGNHCHCRVCLREVLSKTSNDRFHQIQNNL